MGRGYHLQRSIIAKRVARRSYIQPPKRRVRCHYHVLLPSHFYANSSGGLGKQAAKIEDIFKGLDPDVVEKSKDITVRLKSHPLPIDWDFIAFSGDKKYEVSVRALTDQDPNAKLVKFADVLVSCTCPFWQWQGPEYHAKQREYLFGDPRGTASKPVIKDPENHKYLCKHAYKVLDAMKLYIIH